LLIKSELKVKKIKIKMNLEKKIDKIDLSVKVLDFEFIYTI
jgi:hypothetical protein